MPAKYYVDKRFPRSAVLIFIIISIDLAFLAVEWNNIYVGLETLMILIILLGYACVLLTVGVVRIVNPKPYDPLIQCTRAAAWAATATCLAYICYASYLASVRTIPNAAWLFQSCYTSFFCLLILATVTGKYNEQLDREIQEAEFVSANAQLKQTVGSLRNPLLTSQMNHTNAFTARPITYMSDDFKAERAVDVESGYVSPTQVIAKGDTVPIVSESSGVGAAVSAPFPHRSGSSDVDNEAGVRLSRQSH
jgi:multisubunit Na+/H+ antiporter MnhG subunit